MTGGSLRQWMRGIRIFVEIEHAVLQRKPVRTAFRLVSAEGIVLFTSTDADEETRYGRDRDPGVYVSRCEIPPLMLKRGLYFVTVSSSIPMVKVNFMMEGVVSFSVEQTEGFLEDRVGVIAPALSWDVDTVAGLENAGRQGRAEVPWSPG